MKRKLAVLILLITVTVATGQTSEYSSWTKKADSLFKMGNFKGSGQAYSMAFKSFGWKGYLTDRYNAACSWALASMPDSAFSCLFRIVTKGNYSDYNRLSSDPNLQSLHSDTRWHPLITKVKVEISRMLTTPFRGKVTT